MFLLVVIVKSIPPNIGTKIDSKFVVMKAWRLEL